MTSVVTFITLSLALYISLWLGEQLPLMGSALSSLLIGMVIRHTPLYDYLSQTLIKFFSKFKMQLGIVLLGFTLSFSVISQVGFKVILILILVLFTALATSLLLNRQVQASSKLALLIGIGTSICGGSAIVASAPIIEADDEEMTVSITTMFLYSILAIIILPVIGNLLGLSDFFYGILSGATINDTPSVVAAAYNWSQDAGDLGLVVKLVRTLMIVPVTLILTLWQYRTQSNDSSQKSISIKDVRDKIPNFIVLFMVAVLIANIFTIPDLWVHYANRLSKIFLAIALICVGMGVHMKDIQRAGIKPILLGAVTWLMVFFVAFVSISLIY